MARLPSGVSAQNFAVAARSKSKASARGGARYAEFRMPLLWLAVARGVLGLVAIPLAPFLYREHFLVLVLLRPTKEVLLVGGFLARRGNVEIPEMVAAAIPLAILAVWQFFALGRAWCEELTHDRLPWIARRVLPPDKISRLQKTLRTRGQRIVFLGRLAVFPSALLGAAAGSSEMKTREFLPADAAGGAASILLVTGAGYLLGSAYESAGPWITIGGVVALLGMLFVLGRFMNRA